MVLEVEVLVVIVVMEELVEMEQMVVEVQDLVVEQVVEQVVEMLDLVVVELVY